ncbi:MAG: hypothetical protein MJZ62_06405 [Bacteroidales bacterium]|nr:hypothetical protein [Bacteroidales bacterium]
MPTLGKGTECIKLLLSQTSNDMNQPLVPMLFPILGAHMTGTEFLYPDQTWKEPCGIMTNLVAESGGNKGQLSNQVETLSYARKDCKNDLYDEWGKLEKKQRYPPWSRSG